MKQVSPETLATYRNDIVPLGRFCGVGGQLLLDLLDYIDSLKHQVLELQKGPSHEPCALRDGVIYCQCGNPSSHYGTMGERGAREVRCVPTPPPSGDRDAERYRWLRHHIAPSIMARIFGVQREQLTDSRMEALDELIDSRLSPTKGAG